jgi:hypothetical protein
VVETTYMGILFGVLTGLIIVGLIGCARKRKLEEKQEQYKAKGL